MDRRSEAPHRLLRRPADVNTCLNTCHLGLITPRVYELIVLFETGNVLSN